MEGQPLASLEEGAIAMHAIRLPSVSLEESVRAVTRVERVLRERFPDEIETVVSKTGRPEVATDPMGVELTDVIIMLTPVSEWTAAETKEELIETIEHTLQDEVPGQAFSFSQPIEMRMNELISGVRSDVAVNLYGPVFAELEEAELGDSTVVFFFSDHGAGLPRGKRVLHDSGMNVPLLVRFPEKYQHLVHQTKLEPGEPAEKWHWNSPLIISPHLHTRQDSDNLVLDVFKQC